MKKIIVVFALLFGLFGTSIAQDSVSRFSVGLLTGPYFNTGHQDEAPVFSPIFARKTKEFSVSYGAEFTWYFSNTGKFKKGITARFIYSENIKSTEDNRSPSNDPATLFYNVESSSFSQRSYMGSIGYRVCYVVSNRINVLSGAEILYEGKDKIFTDYSYKTYFKNTADVISELKYNGKSRPGYSAGIGLNIGIEYKLLKDVTFGAQVSAGAFYTKFYGQSGYRRSDWTPGLEEKNYKYQNSDFYGMSPMNYSLSARYYF